MKIIYVSNCFFKNFRLKINIIHIICFNIVIMKRWIIIYNEEEKLKCIRSKYLYCILWLTQDNLQKMYTIMAGILTYGTWRVHSLAINQSIKMIMIVIWYNVIWLIVWMATLWWFSRKANACINCQKSILNEFWLKRKIVHIDRKRKWSC